MLIDKIKATVVNKIAVLKDINGNKIIPMTITKAVQDDNGKKLNVILDEKMDKTQGSEMSGWITTLNDKTFYAKGYYNGDMNSLVSVGCYLCGNEATIKNKPNTTTWGTVTVFLGGTGSVTQEWVSADNVSKWYRHFNGSVWGEWREVVVDDTVIISDANSISQSGKYLLANITLNKPSDNQDWYACEATFENGGITGSVTATCYAGHNLGRTYTRVNLHGTWYDWQEIATTEPTTVTIPDNTDLAAYLPTMKENKIYRQIPNTGVTNSPNSALYCFYTKLGSVITCVEFDGVNSLYYITNIVNGGYFGWQQIAPGNAKTINQTDLDNIKQKGDYVFIGNGSNGFASGYVYNLSVTGGMLNGFGISITQTITCSYNTDMDKKIRCRTFYQGINLWSSWQEISTTSVITPSLLNAWTGNVKVVKNGGMTCIVGSAFVGSNAAGTVIMSGLPYAHESAVFELYNGSVQSVGSAYVAANGNMLLSQVTTGMSTGTQVFFNITYPTL